ncbi:SMC family ATPase [Curtobacterium flaccumfaciens]|nr:SMC family ATPase [Curtobacterium flaccumfaciens]
MYLHRLELRAIGPYPDVVSIDFATLAASGVFLLEGPTGSGKSTIIDAVVFVLYGGLAGAEASNDRLHSQHADPSVEPYVELVFETGAGVFRVRRTPQYDRPKKSGKGLAREPASAQLFRLAGPADVAGEPMSSRIPEVGAEVTRIVGLDKAQFLQTVVLPQGEFARFLRSPGEERRKLLQSLFGTQVYDRTADELAARRRAVQAEVESADARVRDALSRFAQAAGVEAPEEAAVPATVATLRAAADAAETARAVAASDCCCGSRARTGRDCTCCRARTSRHAPRPSCAPRRRRLGRLRRSDALGAGRPRGPRRRRRRRARRRAFTIRRRGGRLRRTPRAPRDHGGRRGARAAADGRGGVPDRGAAPDRRRGHVRRSPAGPRGGDRTR